LRMRSTGGPERNMTERQKDQTEQTQLHEKIDQMLTEARVILPGAQALLGFQLAIVLTEAFEKLPMAMKLVHGAALLLVAVSIVLLMAPATYHRIVYAGEDSEEFHRIGSRFVTWSTVPLAVGLSADVFVVGTKILPSEIASSIVATVVLMFLFGLWYALPLLARRLKKPTARTGRALATSRQH
jgi:NhaP-type Na+/H+ or K+/H+ antiporter